MRNICVPAVSVLIVSLDHVPSRSDKHIKFIVLYVIVFTTVLCVLSPTTVIWLYTIRAICRAGPVPHERTCTSSVAMTFQQNWLNTYIPMQPKQVIINSNNNDNISHLKHCNT